MKSLQHDMKHRSTMPEYIFMKSVICFFSMTFWSWACSAGLNCEKSIVVGAEGREFGRASRHCPMHFCLLAVVALLALSPYASADTEIVNFEASPSRDVDLTQYTASWRSLKPAIPSVVTTTPAPRGSTFYQSCNFTTHHCPHEVWFILDASAGTHTVRISYAATSSVQYKIELYSPAALSTFIGTPPAAPASPARTTLSYARVTVRRVGILTPGMAYAEPQVVTFHIVLEQLLLGVLPQSMLPVVAAIVVVLGGVAYALPRLLKTFESLAREARFEVRKAQ